MVTPKDFIHRLKSKYHLNDSISDSGSERVESIPFQSSPQFSRFCVILRFIMSKDSFRYSSVSFSFEDKTS